MILFYSNDIQGGVCRLNEEESAHCVRVLRHRCGDSVDIIDGCGTLYHCRLEDDSPKHACARILSEEKGFGAHPYRLRMAVCPTKNNERFEWFIEKAVEVGLDTVSPVIGERSERKVYKTERAEKIALSAAKQSLKAAVTEIEEPVSVKDLIAAAPQKSLRMIACCFEDEQHPRISVAEAIKNWQGEADYTVLIGPEGDFSPSELQSAIDAGFVPVHLGESRLRTETAALTAVEAVYILKTLV